MSETFRARIEDLSQRNKKPPVAYERILKQAEERSRLEMSVALGCAPEDVAALFERGSGDVAAQN